jgi:hypothetical protein
MTAYTRGHRSFSMLERPLRTFVEFDAYEASALKRLQKDISKSKGKEVKISEIIRGCVRMYVHEVMGQDYVLGPDIRAMLGLKLPGGG